MRTPLVLCRVSIAAALAALQAGAGVAQQVNSPAPDPSKSTANPSQNAGSSDSAAQKERQTKPISGKDRRR
ncbi:MAG: hypothetical protein WB679_26280, partial [Terracidiphilus sp.]